MTHFRILITLAIAYALSACNLFNQNESVRISGNTMGTTYHIAVNSASIDTDPENLKKEMEAVFADVNAKMSNWIKSSEVSLFNASLTTIPFKVSRDFITVMTAANDVHDKTSGKFDITLGPLINLWGFGPRKADDPVPEAQDIERALSSVGQRKFLALDPDALTISKVKPDIGINLSAIAKGFGIDAAANKLSGLGYKNYMVEIGGDLRASGHNDKGESWRIGIEKPEAGTQSVKLIIPISNAGMATSGDYRNYIEHKGKRYSHILDPQTGKPITHRTTSVSVITENAMMADAWATALLIVGAEEGLKLAEENNLAAYFISRKTDGHDSYTFVSSSAFKALQK